MDIERLAAEISSKAKGFKEAVRMAYEAGVRDSADTCLIHIWTESTEWWMATSKKNVSARAAEECAKAVNKLIT